MYTNIKSLLHAAHNDHDSSVGFSCEVKPQDVIFINGEHKSITILTQAVLNGLGRRYYKTHFSPEAISLDTFLKIYEKKTNKDVVMYLIDEVGQYLTGMDYNDVVYLLVNYLYLSLEANTYDANYFNATKDTQHARTR